MYQAQNWDYMSSRVDIIRDIDTFLSVQTEWDRLVADSFGNQPFFRHFWYANYYRAYFMRQPYSHFYY